MKKLPISVTDAARNFADCVNRARYQNLSFVLRKNGAPVAELTPSTEKVCSGSDLAAAMAKARLKVPQSHLLAVACSLTPVNQGLVRSEGLCFLPDIDNGILPAYALDAIMA